MQRQVLVIQKAPRTADVPLLQYIDTTRIEDIRCCSVDNLGNSLIESIFSSKVFSRFMRLISDRIVSCASCTRSSSELFGTVLAASILPLN